MRLWPQHLIPKLQLVRGDTVAIQYVSIFPKPMLLCQQNCNFGRVRSVPEARVQKTSYNRNIRHTPAFKVFYLWTEETSLSK
jgi:hypothetical protein